MENVTVTTDCVYALTRCGCEGSRNAKDREQMSLSEPFHQIKLYTAYMQFTLSVDYWDVWKQYSAMHQQEFDEMVLQ